MKPAAAPPSARAAPPTGLGGWHAAALGILLTLVWAATIAVRVWPVPGADILQIGAFAAFAVLVLPALPRGPLLMLATCAAAGLAAAVLRPDGGALVARALGDAAYLSAFFASIAVLREAAASSLAVHRCGDMLVSRPPGRRYAALTLGSGLLSIIINSGALSLLGAMVVATNTIERANGDPRIRAIRARRMMLALLRGFCAGILLSPLSLAFAVVLSAFPQTGSARLLGCGMVFGLFLLLLGGLVDRLSHARPQIAAADRLAEWAAALPLLAIVCSIVAAVVATEVALETSLVAAAMVAVPVCGFGWMLAQTRSLGVDPGTRLARTAHRARDFVVRDLSGARLEVSVVSSAAFIGVILSGLLPLAELRALALASGMSPPLILVAAFVAVVALGQTGINPILSVTVLGAVFPDPQAVGLHPLILALTLFTAWATTTGSSSAIAAVLILARISATPAATIGRIWNGPFTLLTGTAFLLVLLAAHAVTGSGGPP